MNLNNQSTQELLRLLSELKFPSHNAFSKYSNKSLLLISLVYGGVSITSIHMTSTGFRKEIAYFIEYWIPKYIKSFSLGGGDKKPVITGLRKSLILSLPNILESVSINNLKLDEKMIEIILEGSRNWKELYIITCILQMKKRLKIREDLEYKYIKFGFHSGDNSQYTKEMSEINLCKIYDLMVLTNLKNTLQSIGKFSYTIWITIKISNYNKFP